MNLISGTEREMLEAKYWIDKLEDKDKLIMDEDDIKAFNEEVIKKVDGVVDVFKCKETLDKTELTELIKTYKIPSEIRFDVNGEEVTKEFYDSIVTNTNLDGINEENNVQFGMTIRNADVRSFPTAEYIFKTKEDKDFDRFQETGCQAFEPVLILHESKDEKWYFVQIYNYNGWMKKEDVAIGQRADILEFVNSKPFIVVTGNYIQTQYSGYDERVSRQRLYMGTRIPLVEDCPEIIYNQSVLNNYPVRIPVRDQNGKLEFKTALISSLEDVNKGYLTYTRENILKQIFKLINDRYGWGDRFCGRDCSSTLMYVYKTFGFKWARNAGEQENGPGKRFEFLGDDIGERERIFDNVKPGAAIFMPGHIMMYLGKDKGIPYKIHNFHGYGRPRGEEVEFVPVNQVFVTSSRIMTFSGAKFIDKFTSVLQLEL